MEKGQIDRRNRIEKWLQIIIVPIILAMFAEIIREQKDLSLLFAYTATMIIVIASFGLMFLNCYNTFEFFKKRKLEQMKSFADDLQGILDCQFENKFIDSIDEEKTN